MDKTNDNKRAKIIMLILILCILGGVALVYYFDLVGLASDKQYTLNVDSDKRINYEVSNRVTFDTYDNDVIKCNINGIKRINAKGETVWDKPFEMKNPRVVNAEPFVAAGDIKGNSVYVFSKDGYAYDVKTKYSLLMYSINKNGFLVTIEKNEDEHFLRIFNNEGKEVLYRNTTVENDGYPISLNLSPKGDKLATSYVEISGAKMISVISFFDLGYSGDYYVDKMVGSNKFEDELISDIKFINNDYLVAISDKRLLSYKVEVTPNKVWEQVTTNKVERYDLGSNGYFCVSFGEKTPNGSKELANAVILYDKDGNEVLQKKYDKKITYLRTYKDYIIVGNGRHYSGIDSKGNIKWSYDCNKDIKDLIPFEDSRNILLVGKSSIDRLSIFKIETNVSKGTQVE